MTDVCAVLLVPLEGDPLGLLNEGPCGARPPMAWLSAATQGPWVGVWFPAETDDLGTALVLAWDGKAVSEGQHRARLVGYRPEAMGVGIRWIESEARRLMLHGLGTAILLDADGKEVERGQ